MQAQQDYKNDQQLLYHYSDLGKDGEIRRLAWQEFDNYSNKMRVHGISFKYLSSDVKDKIIELACNIAENTEDIDIQGVVEELIRIADDEKIPFIKLLAYDTETLTKRVIDTYVNPDDDDTEDGNNEFEQ